ncbi:MAG: TonB-dependent receptor, partial [Pseudomonadota bacterium]|nr:TonB-dependent receptor [Pseudomonadota bacterium]
AAVTLYGSYSEVFPPQSWVTPDFQPLGVAEGENAEVGIKVSLNDGLATGTLALFQSKLDNLGEFNRVVAGVNTYDGLNYETNGAELEIIGSINDATNVSFGITHLDKVEGDDGEKVRTYLPRTTIKLASAIDISAIPGLTLGASVNWQDDIYIEPAANVRVDQDSYALVNAFARYRLSDDVTLSLNVNNLTDKKYINSLYWTQGFYGAPRQMQASVNWQF